MADQSLDEPGFPHPRRFLIAPHFSDIFLGVAQCHPSLSLKRGPAANPSFLSLPLGGESLLFGLVSHLFGASAIPSAVVFSVYTRPSAAIALSF